MERFNSVYGFPGCPNIHFTGTDIRSRYRSSSRPCNPGLENSASQNDRKLRKSTETNIESRTKCRLRREDFLFSSFCLVYTLSKCLCKLETGIVDVGSLAGSIDGIFGFRLNK